MNIDDIKNQIEQHTGVPASLLKGETVEENIAQAKAFLAYKRQVEQEQPKSTKEQFKEWIQEESGMEPEKDEAAAYLDDLTEEARIEAGGYPIIPDAGESAIPPTDPRSTSEKFAEWFWNASAWNPRNSSGNW